MRLSAGDYCSREGLKNLIHPLFRLEFAITLGTLHQTVGHIVVLKVQVKNQVVMQSRERYLVHCSLCLKFIIALRTFEKVFCVVVLRVRMKNQDVMQSEETVPCPLQTVS